MQKRKITNLALIAALQIVGFLFILPFMVAIDSGEGVYENLLYGTLIGFLLVLVSQIYFVYWYYKTSLEIRNRGYNIPIFILYFIPLANFYWLWKYSEAVEGVTKSKLQAVVVFLVNFLAGIPIAPLILQYYYNNVSVVKKKIKKISKKPAK